MSMPQILATIEGALNDPVLGLSAAASALADDDARIRVDFLLIKWALAGTITDARSPNIMVRPRRWLAQTKLPDTLHRDAEAQVDFGYENFSSDTQTLQDNIAIVATALAQVIDRLREYSDATGGTIIEVLDPVQYDFGQFAGPTSHGFLATITLLERSTQ